LPVETSPAATPLDHPDYESPYWSRYESRRKRLASYPDQAPSLRTLRRGLPWLSDADARVVRGLIKYELNPAVFPAGAHHIRRSHGFPSYITALMAVADAILDTHGVEYLQPFASDGSGPQLRRTYMPEEACWGGSSGQDGGILYCNTGDSYAATLCYSEHTGRFYVACWADFIR